MNLCIRIDNAVMVDEYGLDMLSSFQWQARVDRSLLAYWMLINGNKSIGLLDLYKITYMKQFYSTAIFLTSVSSCYISFFCVIFYIFLSFFLSIFVYVYIQLDCDDSDNGNKLRKSVTGANRWVSGERWIRNVSSRILLCLHQAKPPTTNICFNNKDSYL